MYILDFSKPKESSRTVENLWCFEVECPTSIEALLPTAGICTTPSGDKKWLLQRTLSEATQPRHTVG
jgi:hypothetical protein